MVNNQPLLESKFEALPRARINQIINSLPYPYDVLFAIQYLTASRITETLMLRQKDFSIQQLDGRDLLVILMKVLKRRNKAVYRTVPIRLDELFTDKIISCVNNLNHNNESLLFPNISKNLAWYHLTKNYPEIRTHTFRRSRITELYKDFDWRDSDIVKFISWASSAPMSTYVGLKWRDTAKLILNNS